jgi:hypothetical protein
MLYKINFCDLRNVLLVWRDIDRTLLPAISCCRRFVDGLRYVNVLLSNLNNSFVCPSFEGVFMIQIMIPVILRNVCQGQYHSQCPVHHNK